MRRYMKSLFCFILCAFLLSGCRIDISGINDTIDVVKPKDVTGEMNYENIFPSDGIPSKKLEFENISFIGGNAKIKIIPSDETKVEASYPIGMHEHNFRISVREGEIEISAPKQTNFKADNFEIKVYANIEELEIVGGIAVEMDASASGRLDLDVTGGAEISVYNIAADYMEVDVAGAADMNLSGQSEVFEMEVKGACSVDAKSLACRKAEVKISGAGDAEISVTEELFTDIDGVGVLRYYGDPLVKNISGGLTDIDQVSKEIYGG